MANTAQPIVIRESKRISPFEAIFSLAVLIGGGWFGIKKFREWRAEKEGEKAGSDPDIQVAQRIRNAIQGAGTDIPGLYKAAADIHDYAAVAKAYKKSYSTTIEDDMRGEHAITPEVQEKFFAIIGLKPVKDKPNKVPPAAKVQPQIGYIIVAKFDTQVRKTPIAINPLVGSGNKIKLAKAGQVIGTFTGGYHMDSENVVAFYEVKSNNFKVWVAGSRIEAITPTEAHNRINEFKGLVDVTQKEFDGATATAFSGFTTFPKYKVKAKINETIVNGAGQTLQILKGDIGTMQVVITSVNTPPVIEARFNNNTIRFVAKGLIPNNDIRGMLTGKGEFEIIKDHFNTDPIKDPKYSGRISGTDVANIVIAVQDAVLRRTPIKISASQPGNNRIKTVQAGQIIGCATGRFSRDEVSNITFYELKVLEANNPSSTGLKVWVEKSDILFLTPGQFKKRVAEFSKKGSIYLLSKEDWQAADMIYNGPDFTKEIQAKSETEIFDSPEEKLLRITIPQGTILGYFVEENKNGQIKFQSLNGINWWVNKDSIKEVKK